MKKYINLKYILVALIFITLPNSADAATVYLEASRTSISVGDVAIINVKINADGEILNTIDGEVSLKSPGLNLAVQEFSLANSSFGLWPKTPSLSTDAKMVSFIAGVPGGFSIEGATLFKIIVEAKQEGQVTISPENLSIYLNDGKGTKVSVKTKSITINVTSKSPSVQNDWTSVVSGDKIPPEDFIIVLGQDSNVYDGKKFAYFSAVDNQSGIDHYEVSENGASPVRSGSAYVLQDQKNEVSLEVAAFDKAGNKKSAILALENKKANPWIVVVIGILIAFVIFKIFKRKK